jgi:hypothetical protein
MREFKFFQKHGPLCWITEMGQEIPVSEMGGNLIYNLIGILKGDDIDIDIIPNPYLGKTNDEWLYIFQEELENRFQSPSMVSRVVTPRTISQDLVPVQPMEEPRGNVFDLWYEAYTNGSHTLPVV